MSHNGQSEINLCHAPYRTNSTLNGSACSIKAGGRLFYAVGTF